jgi:hypothetical protein
MKPTFLLAVAFATSAHAAIYVGPESPVGGVRYAQKSLFARRP